MRNVAKWTAVWVKDRDLPESDRGSHAKRFSVLDDPEIKEGMAAYLRTHKWATNPVKFQEFINGSLLPRIAEKYATEEMEPVMVKGLKKFIETELFPQVEMSFGSHLREDIFRFNCVQLRLVLVPQDEATFQAHDDHKKQWGPVDEQPLRHKGPRHGLHQSECTCSTHGHMKDARESLEYGKNYDGYWNGEKFCEQLCNKIIPAFEKLHGAGHQAVFLVDNSQGHSAYAADALLASQMNLNPGGKQACMWNGWFMQNGQRVEQTMIFADNHAKYPGQPKGMKVVLEECGLWSHHLTLKENMPAALASVSLETMWRWEHRVYRWIDAYRDGLGAKDAQKRVKDFSSKKYKSHRHVPETLARTFD
ncbi:hypothetical protein BT96DRAFT_958801 [Gymnopus androsaceus JB14]|uniref:Uncharacterized protein n=1 Tax=Gymnopus androsaceus JB14 TaxID=1447944 RepID=A0A6A4H9W3_9AGAR|nr:hypothetical protein BT96DRAFT_958801 [Gymnopus androsaceus JB14]